MFITFGKVLTMLQIVHMSVKTNFKITLQKFQVSFSFKPLKLFKKQTVHEIYIQLNLHTN